MTFLIVLINYISSQCTLPGNTNDNENLESYFFNKTYSNMYTS